MKGEVVFMEENQEMSLEVKEVRTASSNGIKVFMSLLVILMAVIIAVLAGFPFPRSRKTGTDAETSFHLIPYQYAFPNYGAIANLCGITEKGERLEKGHGYWTNPGDLIVGDIYVVADEGTGEWTALFDDDDDTLQMYYFTESVVVTPAKQAYMQPAESNIDLIITWIDLIQSNYDYKTVDTTSYPNGDTIMFGLTL